METLVQLAALGLCVSVITLLVGKSDGALALLLPLAAVLVGFFALLPVISDLMELCALALSLTALPEELFVPLWKVTAIALIVRFSAALCADAGQSALAALLQSAGAFCALACALPLLEELLDMVEGLL